jgi:pyruvate-formate lyase-activating enzyme
VTVTVRREVAAGDRGFAEGLLVDLVRELSEIDDGDLVAVTSTRRDVGADLEVWSRVTGHAIVASSVDGDRARWVIRKGAPRTYAEPVRAIGSRVWLYSNFDCNLRCDYCCVRSSPTASRRSLGADVIDRICAEARGLGVEDLFVTGGEPFLLADIGEIVAACASVAPTTVLTNGLLFAGKRRDALDSLPRDRVTLQISVDSPTPELHDLHRGAGSWAKALAGVRVARGLGFRVRLAATVSSDADEARFRAFLDSEEIAEEDRVIRRVALRGFADHGVALSKADLVPEVTITARGVYWHPVGADDDDFLITTRVFPLADAIEAVREAWRREREVHEAMAEIFHCA